MPDLPDTPETPETHDLAPLPAAETRTDLLAPPQRALLVAIEHRRGDSARSLEELGRLVAAAGILPAASVTQVRERPHPAHFLGKGKIQEAKGVVLGEDLDLAVFDGHLSPRQAGNVGEILERPVMDRSEIILEIFARHARTSEGRRQVELARLEYLLPRLVGRGKGMSQIAGGRMAGGMGVRGPGETALEMDRRTLRRRMTNIRHSLVEVEKRRSLERTERVGSGLRLVGLVGYTNAGKSSLLNALAGAAVVSAHDRLFETLDTTIRRVDLGERTEALVSDTVGFLDDLPHTLIAAFRATLEETVQADLLVEVLDASDPELERQHHTVEGVLTELAVQNKPRLVVLNKWDLVPAEQRPHLQQLFPGALPLSATAGVGLQELRDDLRRALGEEMVPLTLRIPYNRMALLQFAPGQGRVVHADYEYEYVSAQVRVLPRLVDQLQRYVVPG